MEERLKQYPIKLWTLNEIERTGGEADFVEQDENTGEYVFSIVQKKVQRGGEAVVMSGEGLESRKEHPSKHTAINMANEMGVDFLTQDHYHEQQKSGTFDSQKSIWLNIPLNIRKLGGSIFADFRFGLVLCIIMGRKLIMREEDLEVYL